MNTINTKIYRCIAIVLMMIGVATIVACGGGGGFGGSTDPPAGTDPTLAITAANGESASISARSAVTN
jgi:hypothetical protein